MCRWGMTQRTRVGKWAMWHRDAHTKVVLYSNIVRKHQQSVIT